MLYVNSSLFNLYFYDTCLVIKHVVTGAIFHVCHSKVKSQPEGKIVFVIYVLCHYHRFSQHILSPGCLLFRLLINSIYPSLYIATWSPSANIPWIQSIIPFHQSEEIECVQMLQCVSFIPNMSLIREKTAHHCCVSVITKICK